MSKGTSIVWAGEAERVRLAFAPSARTMSNLLTSSSLRKKFKEKGKENNKKNTAMSAIDVDRSSFVVRYFFSKNIGFYLKGNIDGVGDWTTCPLLVPIAKDETSIILCIDGLYKIALRDLE